MSEPQFGVFAPSPRQQRVRALGRRLPYNYWGRKAASLLLGAAGGRSGRAFDVAVFGSQKARLRPHDNICEKRVFITPQHWDPGERRLLAETIGAHPQDAFYFADIGANAGLYTLFARSACAGAAKRLRAFCVEADPEMQKRLAFNLGASGADDDVCVFACAAAARSGVVKFYIDRTSRGMSRIDQQGERDVPARALASLVNEAAFPRIDAMKIDIEGQEHPALDAFFGAAAPALWPGLMILETSHEDGARSALKLALDRGYLLRLQTKLNAVLARPRG